MVFNLLFLFSHKKTCFSTKEILFEARRLAFLFLFIMQKPLICLGYLLNSAQNTNTHKYVSCSLSGSKQQFRSCRLVYKCFWKLRWAFIRCPTFIIPSPKLSDTLPEAITLSIHSSVQGITPHKVNPVLVTLWRNLGKTYAMFQMAELKHRNLLSFLWLF